jgi:hypothetical protein
MGLFENEFRRTRNNRIQQKNRDDEIRQLKFAQLQKLLNAERDFLAINKIVVSLQRDALDFEWKGVLKLSIGVNVDADEYVVQDEHKNEIFRQTDASKVIEFLAQQYEQATSRTAVGKS